MQKIIKYFFLSVLMVVTTSEAFFLQNKDFRKMLRMFPKAFEIETTPKVRPHRYRHREEPNYHRDDYFNDNYDRHDTGDNPRNSVRPNRGRLNGKYVYIYDKKPSHLHSHEHCDHPDHHHYHHHQKYPEDRVEKHQHNKKNKYKDSEEVNDSYEHKSNYEENYHKKKISSDEKQSEDVNHNNSGNSNKKDYVTGVLVTIPKIKSEDDLENYYKQNKQQNVFLQQLFKTEDDDYHHHHHHHAPEDDLKAYLY